MRYAHTNLIVRDVHRAIAFYRDVFACVPMLPARDLDGDWLVRGTAVPGAALRGMHLRLPGQGDDGATLEIYTYASVVDAELPVANRVGFGHLAFEVEDVSAALTRVREHGGGTLGEIVQQAVDGVGMLTFTYARDPEGNILELQSWDRASAVEVDTRAFYDAWAARYDNDENPTRDLASQVLRAMLPPLDGATVLELGCGSGRNTEALVAAEEVTAIDLSDEMLARARARICADHVHFAAHDLTQPLPVPDASIDLVVISLVLEHIEEVAAIYAEVSRVLRLGGQALVLELHPVRQQIGKRAHFERDDGAVVSAPAFLHPVGDHVSAALAAGLTLAELKEPGSDGALPRLLALRLRR